MPPVLLLLALARAADDDAWLARVVALEDAGRDERALALATRWTERDPSALAWAVRSDVLRDLGRVDEALAVLETGLSAAAGADRAHLLARAASLHELSGNARGAIDALAAAIDGDEAVPAADAVAYRLRLAGYLVPADAAPLYAAALSRADTPALRAAVLVDRARMALGAGDRLAARVDAGDALDGLDPAEAPATAARAWQVRAQLAWAEGDRAAAEAAQAEAVALWERADPITAREQGSAWLDHAHLAEGRGDYAASAERAARALERVGEDGAFGVDPILFSLARAAAATGALAEADGWYARALAAAERDRGRDSLEVAQLLSARAALRHREQRLDEALALVREALEIHARIDGPPGARLSMLHNLAAIERARGNPAAAVPALRDVLDQTPPGTASWASTAEALAGALTDLGRDAEALPLYQDALAAWTAALGPDHPDVGVSSASLAAALRRGGDPEAAIPLYERAIALGTPLSALDARLGLALAHADAGREALARAQLEAVLADQRALLGEAHPDLAGTLSRLADLAIDAGAPRRARAHLREAAAILAAARPEGHPDRIALAGRLGDLAAAEGDLRAALHQYDLAVAAAIAAHGPDHPTVGHLLGRRGHARLAARDLVGAREDADRAVAIAEALDRDHPDAAVARSNRAGVRLAQGDADGAMLDVYRALIVWEARPGVAHPVYATGLNNGAAALEAMGQLEAARDLYLTAIERWTAALGADRPDVARAHVSVASVLTRLGQLGEAAAHLRAARQIHERVLRGDHPDLARALDAEAELHLAAGDPAAADRALRAALRVRERLWGEDHPALMSTWLNLAIRALDRGDALAAADAADRALALADASAEALLDHGSERERLLGIRARRGVVDAWLAAHPAEEAAAHEVVRRYKGVVRAALAAERGAALRDAPDEVREAAAALVDVRARLAALRLSTPAPGEQAARREALVALSEQKEALEARVAGAVRRPAIDLGADDLCAALGPGAALVDLLRWRSPVAAADAYLAFVVRGADCATARVDLGPAAPIDAAVARYRRVLGSGAAQAAFLDPPAAAVREAVWDPVAEAVGGAARVWIAPDGALAGVSFAGLPTAAGRYLVEERAFAYADAPAALAAADGPGARAEGAVVVGGVRYGAAPDHRVATRGEGPVDGPALRGGCALDAFVDLPGTAAEAEAVAARLGEGVTRLAGDEATEGAVAGALAGRRVVHLATHGFFADEACAAADPAAETLAAGFHPMTLSGLALAGANEAVGGEGLWTAEEVSALDLHGTELVVLSACETGRGALAAGEGVLGLRRAFALAGARAQVMSLWAVDDAATARLMDGLYAALLDEGLDPPDALRRAQLALLAEARAAGDPLPGHWAAFIGGR